MGSGIWAIVYDLQNDGRQNYLTWFHEVHIPEKLSRPGYESAAHFRSLDAEASEKPAGSSCRGASNLALFVGETTRTFFDPSPGQLKQRQDELTRTMIGRRIGAVSTIYTIEWRMDQNGFYPGSGEAPIGRFIRMERFADPDKDEDLEVWCAQERAIQVSRIPGCLGITKVLAAMGAPRHALISEFSDLDCPEAKALFSNRREPENPGPFGFCGVPFSGQRICPPV